MKKLIFGMLLAVMLFSSVALVGCSNSTQSLAKELSTAVSNFVNSVSSLDWPEYEQLDAFDSITIKGEVENNNASYASQNDNNASNTQTEGVVVDTSIDTSEIYTWTEILRSKVNVLMSKRSDLLKYIDEIYANNVNLTEADTLAIKVYMNIIKDNSTYLTSYKGMLKNQLNEATNLYNQNKNTNLINAYLIKAVETLQSRSAKVDTAVLAMNSIIDIISSNLIKNNMQRNVYIISPRQQDDDQPINEPTDEPTKDEPITDDQNDNQLLDNEQSNTDQIDEAQDDEAVPEEAINFESTPQQVDNVSPEENDGQQVANTAEENLQAEQEAEHTTQTQDNEE